MGQVVHKEGRSTCSGVQRINLSARFIVELSAAHMAEAHSSAGLGAWQANDIKLALFAYFVLH